MTPDRPVCRFLPAERASREEVLRQHRLASGAPLLRALLDAMPVMVVLLNKERQIVCANRAAQEKLGGPAEALLGRRFGEAAGCVHSGAAGGCGTTQSCSLCGTANAQLDALSGRPGARECRISTLDPARSLDLMVWTTPFVLEGEDFLLTAALDIANEKRRRALERVFFHDALNMVGAVRGLAELLPQAGPEQLRAFSADLSRSAEQLVGELASQRDLAAAEVGELIVDTGPCEVRSLLAALAGVYRAHDAAQGRGLVLDPSSPQVAIVSSRVLLTRVVGNMIKNALEAERRGATVTLGCAREPDGGASVWVRNPSAMPREVQLQVFQRSFSTKDPSRGLGAYGMRLLSERYLGGRVSFTSDPERGTEFRLVLPPSPPPPRPR